MKLRNVVSVCLLFSAQRVVMKALGYEILFSVHVCVKWGRGFLFAVGMAADQAKVGFLFLFFYFIFFRLEEVKTIAGCFPTISESCIWLSSPLLSAFGFAQLLVSSRYVGLQLPEDQPVWIKILKSCNPAHLEDIHLRKSGTHCSS